MGTLVTVVLLLALLGWFLLPGRQREAGEPVDEEELARAEREVRDLGVEQRPDSGFEGDDWGPGAPKH